MPGPSSLVLLQQAAAAPGSPKLETLFDPFNASDPAKWIDAPNVSIVGGQLQLTTSTTYEGRKSLLRYDLTNSYAVTEMVQTSGDLTGTGTVDTAFSLQLDANNYLTWVREGTLLYAQRVVAGSATNTAQFTWSATTHRWLRYLHNGTTIAWQTSPDGINWTTQGTPWAPTFPVTSLKVSFETGMYAGNTAGSGTPALFDSFNVLPATVTGTGALSATPPTLSGAGTLALTGSGAAAATAATLSGAGALRVTGAGTPTAAPATLTGAGSLALTGAGSLTATPATVSGAGAATVTGTGALAATPATLAGTGTERLTGTGALSPSPATLSGSGTVTSPGVVAGTGALTAPAAGMSGAGTLKVVGAGQLAAQAATAATAALLSLTGTGALGAPPSGLSADGAVTAPVAGSGVLVAVQASLTGTGTVVDPNAPIVLAGPLETLTVGADNRTALVGGELRALEVGGESRRFQVVADQRTDTVPAATRNLATVGS